VAFLPKGGASHRRFLLGSTHEFAKSKTEGRSQRIGDLNSDVYLTQLDGADIRAVHTGAFREVFLREPKFLSGQADGPAEGEPRESCCLCHAIFLVS
jgi:hypothetical protein